MFIIVLYHAYAYIGAITVVNHQHSHLTNNMRTYQEYLKHRYRLLELASPDEMLDCSSPQYIDLILIKNNKRKPIVRQTKRKGRVEQDDEMEYVTLSEALDVENQKKKVVLIEGDVREWVRQPLPIIFVNVGQMVVYCKTMMQ